MAHNCAQHATIWVTTARRLAHNLGVSEWLFLMGCKRCFSTQEMQFPDDMQAVLLEEGLLSNDLDAVLVM